MSSVYSWNKIVSQYNKNLNVKEEIIQNCWETLFSTLFNYPDSDIDAQRPVQMGCTQKYPDIIIKNGDEDLFVVELKRHSLHDGQEQLFSYLNQLKIDIGVLVCDKLYVYDFDFTKREENFLSVEIEFTQDNPDGEKFVELFVKDNFDKQKIKDFIKNKNQSENNIFLIREELNNESVVQILKNYLTQKYPENDVEKVFEEYQINIQRKIAQQTVSANSSIRPETRNFTASSNGKDFTQFMINGVPSGGKTPTSYKAVKTYIQNHPDISYEELKKVFPDEAMPGFKKLLRKQEEISDKKQV